MKQQLFYDMTLSVSSFFRVLFPGVFDVRTWHLPGLILKNTLPLFLHSPAKKVIPLSKSTELLTTIVFIVFILAMHSPKCQQQSQEGRKALQCIVMVQAINFLAFLVSSLQFAFTTPLCINCQAASNQLFQCNRTALSLTAFHNTSLYKLSGWTFFRSSLRLYCTLLSQHLLFELRGRNRLFIRFFLLLYCTLLSQHLLFWISHH